MVFSSLTFLQCFLPLCLLAYFLVPQKWRNGTLFLFSLLFYAWGEPVYVVLMLFSTVLDYTCGQMVERHRGQRGAKIALLVSLCVNLGLLGVFKYSDFLIGTVNSLFGTALPQPNLPLPIGISFYTFQTMSYTIDVYRRDAPVQRNPVTFGAFVTMFPQLIAGPIVKYKTVAAELEHRTYTMEQFALGAQRFCVGLAKKVLLANSIGALWEAQLAAQSAGTLTVFGGWMGLLAFGFQIYFDFSGYSDMAIGLGRMLGFRFNENFDYPYLAASVTEFWRRWHMSLTSWFREYLYIPLGGNRGGIAKTLRNLLIVWFCTGFWHGASWNFILWGLYFALWLILEKYVLRDLLARTPAAVKHLYTLAVVFVGWGLFAMEDLSVCGRYLAACFGAAPAWSAVDGYTLRSYAVTFLLLVVASTNWGARTWARIPDRARRILAPVLMALSLVVCTAYLVDGSYNPFLYFRF